VQYAITLATEEGRLFQFYKEAKSIKGRLKVWWAEIVLGIHLTALEDL
jgi:hypothetical protein